MVGFACGCSRCNRTLSRCEKRGICIDCENDLIKSSDTFYIIYDKKILPNKKAFETLNNEANLERRKMRDLENAIRKKYKQVTAPIQEEIRILKNLGCFRKLYYRMTTGHKCRKVLEHLENECKRIYKLEYSEIQTELGPLIKRVELIDLQAKEYCLGASIYLKQWRYRENSKGMELLHQAPLQKDPEQVEHDKVFELFGAVINFAENHNHYTRRKKDYRRGNLIDNYIRKKWRERVLKAYDYKCMECGSTGRLDFDHFWLPKNEGGNFVMIHSNSRHAVSNVAILCSSCNSGKSDREIVRYLSRFDEELQKRIYSIQIGLSLSRTEKVL